MESDCSSTPERESLAQFDEARFEPAGQQPMTRLGGGPGHLLRPRAGRPLSYAPDQWFVTLDGDIVNVAGSLQDALSAAEDLAEALRSGARRRYVEVVRDDGP